LGGLTLLGIGAAFLHFAKTYVSVLPWPMDEALARG
jgi:hypothetical protein